MIHLNELKAQLLQTPIFQQEYEQADMEYSLVEKLIETRLAASLSRGQVAERMGTTQTAVARLDSGMTSPSFAMLCRFAQAIGTKICVDFVSLER